MEARIVHDARDGQRTYADEANHRYHHDLFGRAYGRHLRLVSTLTRARMGWRTQIG